MKGLRARWQERRLRPAQSRDGPQLRVALAGLGGIARQYHLLAALELARSDETTVEIRDLVHRSLQAVSRY